MTCKDCIHYTSHRHFDPLLDEVYTDEDVEYLCPEFKDKSRFVELPCKIGDTVYKICPKCSQNHNGSCQNCAWVGCAGGCDVGVGVWGDGSFNELRLQIVEKKIWESGFVKIVNLWNIQYFATKEEAEIALKEYDFIRKISDRKERKKQYDLWEEKRSIGNIFTREEAEKKLEEME